MVYPSAAAAAAYPPTYSPATPINMSMKPQSFAQPMAQLPIGNPLDGRGWGEPVWSWAIVFILVIAAVVLLIVTLVKVCNIYPKRSSKCYDKNYCTNDYKVRGGCFSLRKPNGHSCWSSCYESGDLSECWEGECIGQGCLGQCSNVTTDCPTLTVNATNLPSGLNSTECTKNRCIYTATSGLGPDYQSECDDATLQKECLAFLATNGTYVAGSCLHVQAFCTYGAGGYTFTCRYSFACAEPYNLA